MVSDPHRDRTDIGLRNVREMLEFARAKLDPQKRAQIIADAQHLLGWVMRSAMAECEAAKKPWRAVAATVGMPHPVLYRQYKNGGPVIAAEAHYSPDIHIAIGFRTLGDVDDRWRLITADEAAGPALKSAEFLFDPANTELPFARQRIELRYRNGTPDELENLGPGRFYPFWQGELGRRPIHLVEPLFGELFGPADTSSPERAAWVAEGARLTKLRRNAALQS